MNKDSHLDYYWCWYWFGFVAV